MIYRKQTGFDAFRCIADACPKSCCEGWQIMIDEGSLEKYERHAGAFADRLQKGVDAGESCFRQNGVRCAMLADSGLCDLQSTLGESWLCDTCRQYPRHVEEFPDLREYSLSLSCPEAVRMLLEDDCPFVLADTEDDLPDDAEDYEDFDPFLFDRLLFAREQLFSLAKNQELPLGKRMDMIAAAAYSLQAMYDEGDIFAMDELTYGAEFAEPSYSAASDEPSSGEIDSDHPAAIGFPLSYAYFMDSLRFLTELEVLESSWSERLRKAIAFWQAHAPAQSAAPDPAAGSEPSVPDPRHRISQPDADLSRTGEKLLCALLYTYFCGSIYDGQIYARTMIAVMSVRWILALMTALPELSEAECIYLFSREVEHSDVNINMLISHFEAEL